jgi:hypothetical protein
MTAVPWRCTCSLRLRGSRKLGKHEPALSMGMASSIEPMRIVPGPLTVAVAARQSLSAAFAVAGTGGRGHLRFQQPLGQLDHGLAQHIGVLVSQHLPSSSWELILPTSVIAVLSRWNRSTNGSVSLHEWSWGPRQASRSGTSA